MKAFSRGVKLGIGLSSKVALSSVVQGKSCSTSALDAWQVAACRVSFPCLGNEGESQAAKLLLYEHSALCSAARSTWKSKLLQSPWKCVILYHSLNYCLAICNPFRMVWF